MWTMIEEQILRIWIEGGWTMIPLCGLAIYIYFTAARLLHYFAQRDFKKVPESVWRRWIRDPEHGEGDLGEIIRYTQDETSELEEIQNRFEEIRAARIPRLQERLRFMNILVTAAPLLGLLGTVLGMLKTFHALATSSGKMVDQIAEGISQALITTEMGLLIALPGYFLGFMIRKNCVQYEAFLIHLESVTLQILHHTIGKDTEDRPIEAAPPVSDVVPSFKPMPA